LDAAHSLADMIRRSWKPPACVVFAVTLFAAAASAADSDVKRQLQLRDQQQMELRLKMQQQLDRATQPPQTQSPSADLRGRQLDRDQQQRLQTLNEQISRGGIAPPAPGTSAQMQQELERQRALRLREDELRRLEAERRTTQ
jgi:hypothetical protein